MSERLPPDLPSPLHLLKGAEVTPLSKEAEAARRQRIVARIDALRVELAASTEEGVGGRPRVEQQARGNMSTPSVNPSPLGRWWGTLGESTKTFVRDLSSWRWPLAAMPVGIAVLVLIAFSERLRNADDQEALLRVASGELTVESGSGPLRLGQDGQWKETDDVTVTTQATEATVVLSSRTSVVFSPQSNATISREVLPSTKARLLNPDERIRLSGGSVTLNVPKLAPERSLSVVTEHATVVVRGTIFAVMVEALPSHGKRTRVTVQEGEVSVRSAGRELKLNAGQEWSSSELSPEKPNEAAETSRGQAALDAGTSGVSKPASANKAPISELARQNQLFESAQAAKRAGQHQLALTRFSELMRTYPRSEQAHNARVEHFRLLRAMGRHVEARRSAEAYLRDYPKGFAVAEARKLTK
jgi:hypothetical protein